MCERTPRENLKRKTSEQKKVKSFWQKKNLKKSKKKFQRSTTYNYEVAKGFVVLLVIT